MTKIITCSELRYHTLTELEALFRTLQIRSECRHTPRNTADMARSLWAPGSAASTRSIACASSASACALSRRATGGRRLVLEPLSRVPLRRGEPGIASSMSQRHGRMARTAQPASRVPDLAAPGKD
jgi:hypothetical protein